MLERCEVFYSTKDETIVVVPNFYIIGTGNLDEFLGNIEFFRKQILENLQPDSSKISLYYVVKSVRYKYQHIFFVHGVPPQDVPEFVTILKDADRYDVVT